MFGPEGWLSLAITDRSILAILLVANFAVAIAFCIHEILRSRTSQGSIGWLLSLLMLPFPTTLIYAVFGLKLFDDYVQVQTHSGRALRRVRAGQASILDLPTTDQWPVLAGVSQLPFLAGNDVEILIDGDATFDSMMEGIRRARSTVLVQFYIIRDDRIGKQFAEVLMERARAGVAVYLLYDDVGSFWLNRGYKVRLRDAGVVVAAFNQRHRLLRILGPTRLNYRNHRKVLVVDSHEAWVGGHNLGDEYLGRSKRFGHWRDTHVRVTGPAALAISLSFREDWEWATGRALESHLPGKVHADGPHSVLVMPTGPADVLEDCAIAFMEVISKAQKRLWIVSPYFVPDLDMQTALYAAAMRGVEVKILMAGKADHVLVWLAGHAHARRMIKHGIDIYRYDDGFLHEKVILVDDQIAGIGTVNFDNRSFRINFELTLWFTHQRMIDDTEAMLVTDFAASKQFTLEERAQQGFVHRFLSEAARLLSPVL